VTVKLEYDRHLGFLVNDLARLLRRNFNRRVQSLGLTQAQWRAIAHLSRNEGMTQTELIDRMQNAGWVERRNHPSDRRAVQLYLTGKCEPILAEMQSRATDTLHDALTGIAPSTQQQVMDVLERMKQNLATCEDAAATTETSARTNRDVGRKPARLRRAR
jgi:MarR family transcriptional regulator for hemolysin